MDESALHGVDPHLIDHGGSPRQPPLRKRRLDEAHHDIPEHLTEAYAGECSGSGHLREDQKGETHLDIETVEPDELIEQGEHGAAQRHEMVGEEVLTFPIETKIVRGRKRMQGTENDDGSRIRYYDRYKNQDYVKRNDLSKYCQVCKKKVFGKLRSLPSEHRLRRIWILRLNLDVERSAELWTRDAFSDATHCGEVCSIHFPVGTENYKNRELLPIDMRQDPESYSTHEDELFDFESLELECVFCDAKGPLRNMIPFVRTRSRRYKWINSLTGNSDAKSILSDRLKNGASKFICDWHFNDEDFDINQYGEWRLRKEALPNPSLVETDKKARRIYMVNHGDTILARGIDGRRREELLFARKDYRYLAQKARRTTYASYYGYEGAYAYDPEEGEGEEHIMDAPTEYIVEPAVERPPEADIPTTSTNQEVFSEGVEYSDDSDEEMDAINRIAQIGGEPLSTARFCQVCSRVVSSEKSMKDYRPRTWPFDEMKHEKWLEIMNWPRDFEESMRILWSKRRADFSVNGNYHFCPINVCQSHLDFRSLHEKVNGWLSSYCICCDQDHQDPNLLLPFPVERGDRLLWVHTLLSIPTVNKIINKRWKWLRERLTRPKATKYRICVYHFAQESFVEKDDCIEFNEAALPLPLGLSQYDVTPKGPSGLIMCPLCDVWMTEEDLTEIRTPTTQAERILLVEMLIGDKTIMKKGVEQLCLHSCKICRHHLPNEVADVYSVIAERKMVAQMEVSCLVCNHRDMGSNMIPFPLDQEKRRFWIDALCRDHIIKTRVNGRLQVDGRHYLCAIHFHKNSLRYIPGLGVWKKFKYLPLGVTAGERDRIGRLPDSNYHPLLVENVDDGEGGVVQDLNYDEILSLLGEVPPNYADEFGPAGQPQTSQQQQPQQKQQAAEQHPIYVVASRVVKNIPKEEFVEDKPPELEQEIHVGDEVVVHEEVVGEEVVPHDEQHHVIEEEHRDSYVEVDPMAHIVEEEVIVEEEELMPHDVVVDADEGEMQ